MKAGAASVDREPAAEVDDLAPLLGVFWPNCTVPTLATGVVARTQIIERIAGRTDVGLVLVTGPAGFGKTTLAVQATAADDRRVAWVTVDEHNATPLSLLRSIAVAVHALQPLPRAVVDALLGGEQTWYTAVLPLFASALRDRDGCVLVIDDAHHLTRRDALDCLDHLIDAWPPGSLLILVSRSRLRLRVGRLLLASRAARVEADDLLISVAEATEIVRARGLGLPQEAIEQLVERTEGWAAGLCLAMTLVARPRTGSSSAGGIDDVDLAVRDYLGEEFMDRLPVDIMRFLTRTAILDTLSGPVCDAVLEGEDSGARLEDVARREDVFIVAIGHDRRWFRVHPLVRDFLQTELARREPELLAGLHSRASRWFEAHGDLDRAIMYAKRSGDGERAEDLVIERLLDVATSGGSQTLGRWLSWFTDEECLCSAALSLARAWLAMGEGRADDVEEWLARASVVGSVRPLGDGTPSIDYAVSVTRVMLSSAPGDRLLAALEPLLSDPTTSPFYAFAAIGDAGASWMMGIESSAVLARSEPAWTRFPMARAVALGYLAVMAIERGDRDEAASLRRRTLRTVEEHHLSGHPVVLGTLLNQILLGLDLGDTDVDAAWLARAPGLLAGIGHLAPRSRLLAYMLLAEVHLRLDDLERVSGFLAEAERLARREPWATALVARVASARAQLRERISVSKALAQPGPGSITPAELRLLAYLPTHLSMREIGDRTYRSASTIHSQSISIYRKLGVAKRSDAVEQARKLGLIN